MPLTALSRSPLPAAPAAPNLKPHVLAALAAWFLLVLLLGSAGSFTAPPRTPPLPIALGVLSPLAVFFAGLALSRRFREFMVATDPHLVLGIQAWRFGGIGFLALYAHGILPAVFAWPAGLGDMAIGIAAPWLALALMRDPRFAASRTYVAWNVLGIVDLVIAVSIGALSATFASGAPGEITTAPMAQLPLVLVPAYLVPIFVMLHTVMLMQAHRLAQGAAAGSEVLLRDPTAR